ncbi:lysylphosphatidylglycerol synthase transmembrane domain-containing protein [Chloroflexota bacterium]
MRSRRFWLGLVVSLLFLGLLIWRIDLGEMVRSLREANYLFVVPGIVLYFIAMVFRTLRWWLLLLPLRRIAVGRLFPVVIVGYMANNLLPIRLGELVRSYYVGQREDVSGSAALATIVVERVFDGVTLLFFLAAVSLFLPMAGLVQDLARNTGIPWAVLVTGATLPFVLVLAFLTLVAYWPWWPLRWIGVLTRHLPGGAETRIMRLAEMFITGLGILRQPRRMAALILLSLPVWLTEAAMYYVIGFSFDLATPLGGVGAMAAAIVAVTATSNLALSLPSSQGGIGPFELLAAGTLVVLGVRGETAVAYAVVLHVALLVPVTLLGLVYLWTGKESLIRLVRLGEAEEVPVRPEESP